jgi:hypothetical protein
VRRRGDQILHVRPEARVGELAVAAAEAGEVEAKRGDAELGERAGDAAAAWLSLPQVKQWANSA